MRAFWNKAANPAVEVCTFMCVDGVFDIEGRFQILEIGRGMDCGFKHYRTVTGKNFFKKVMHDLRQLPGAGKLWGIHNTCEAVMRGNPDAYKAFSAMWGGLSDPRAWERYRIMDDEFSRPTTQPTLKLERGIQTNHMLLMGFEGALKNEGYGIQTTTGDLLQAYSQALALQSSVAQTGKNLTIIDGAGTILMLLRDKAVMQQMVKRCPEASSIFPKSEIFTSWDSYQAGATEHMIAQFRATFGDTATIVLKLSDMGRGYGVRRVDLAHPKAGVNGFYHRSSPAGCFVAQNFVETPLYAERDIYIEPPSPLVTWLNLEPHPWERAPRPPESNHYQKIVRLGVTFADGRLICHGGEAKMMRLQAENGAFVTDRNLYMPSYPGVLAQADINQAMAQIRAPLSKLIGMAASTPLTQFAAELKNSQSQAGQGLGNYLDGVVKMIGIDARANSRAAKASALKPAA